MSATSAHNDALQQAINAINELSSLVGRYVYAEAAEEADSAQRLGFAAIKELNKLKIQNGASAVSGVEVGGGVGNEEQAEAA